MNASPQEEVAVNVRAPAAEDPMAALMELCSLSTGINSVSISPFAIIVATNWGISVEGVIGNAGMTSGLICLIACATASLPDIRVFNIYFPSFIDIAVNGQAFTQMPHPLQWSRSKSVRFPSATGMELSGQ